ncbi:hypothetical protein FACS1894184_14950 [Clostridia bacterium]|nr:hypothetical protein FACS1894184_14950 [Clostridia bacterium]
MNELKRFWNWSARDETGEERVLYMEGVIAESGWYDDDITPTVFKDELFSGSGPITIWLSSPGGDVIAASRIYSLLMDYPYDVTVKIDGIAASAASVIAMGGTRVYMAPTALMMVHNPFAAVVGDTEEMRKAIDMLSEVKESIITAYELRTGLSRTKLSHMLDAETWLSANKAVALHFADGILFEERRRQPDDAEEQSYMFNSRAVTNCLLNRVRAKFPRDEPEAVADMELTEMPEPPAPIPEPTPEPEPIPEPEPTGIPAKSLNERLYSLIH